MESDANRAKRAEVWAGYAAADAEFRDEYADVLGPKQTAPSERNIPDDDAVPNKPRPPKDSTNG